MKKTFRMVSILLAVITMLSLQFPIASAAPTVRKKSRPQISLSSKGYSSITLKWKKFGDADGYVVYRKTSKSGDWKSIKTTKSTSYTNNKLKISKKYWYRVRAYDIKNGKRVYSPYSKTKYMSPKLAAASVSVKSATSSSIKLSIKKPSGATGVYIYRRTSSSGKWSKIKTTTSSLYTNTKLKSNKTYYYRVKAYRKSGGKYFYSDYSKQIKKKTSAPIALTPTNKIGDITIDRTTSSVDGLNISGKTITMAIVEEDPYTSTSYKRMVAGFEQKYNCKVTIKGLKFSTYNQQVSQAYASGKPYDICYAHGSMFPNCAITGIYNKLNDYISTADFVNKSNLSAGGIDPVKTSYFVYNKGIYGTCNYYSCNPYVIYYNKVAMAELGYSGNNDPRKLSEKGEWTWSKIISMGKRRTDVNADIYFLSNSFSGRGVNLAFGAPIVTLTNGVYKENVTSGSYIAGLNMMKKLFVGADRIAEPRDSTHPYNSYATMFSGKCFMHTEETSKYLNMVRDVPNSSALNRSKDNIGIVAMPLGETNTNKAYPTGWLTAVCSPKGSDPRIAIAWELYRSSFVDSVVDFVEMNATDKAYANSLLKGNICHEVGNFASSSTNTLSLTEGGVVPNVLRGQDPYSQVNSIKYRMTECINQTMGY